MVSVIKNQNAETIETTLNTKRMPLLILAAQLGLSKALSESHLLKKLRECVRDVRKANTQ